MECTQRLECTQALYAAETEEIRCPEQIGFLGICGTKYPVKWGPNKIGRDAKMCSIVLKLDSVSRTHAVLNVLNGKEYMLMDLDSANKTRLNNKILQAYIPYPINNGDTVQFGEVFGVFRLLEDDNDLPMTQAIDVPETPVANKHVSRLNNCGVTTVPESPEVSDRDDSFIMPSQPKVPSFKSPKTKFIKQSGKTTVIQPIGSHQIDNVFWSSSKKSLSLNDSDSNDDSMASANMTHQNDNIHEMETQPPFPYKMAEDRDSFYTTGDTQVPNVSRESIYSANTQYPNDSRDSIYSAATQIPDCASPSIHGLDTQMQDHLPSVQRISEQTEMQFDLITANKENISIHNAETQLLTEKKCPSIVNENDVNEEEDIFVAATQIPVDKPNYLKNHVLWEPATPFAAEKDTSKETLTKNIQSTSAESDKKLLSRSKDKLNTTSDEEILFDELDSQSFVEEFDSHPLIPAGFEFNEGEPEIPLSQTNSKVAPNTAIDPMTSEECDNITMLPKQTIPKHPSNEQDLQETTAVSSVTPKECDDITMLPTQKITSLPTNIVNFTDCEEDNTENNLNRNERINLPKDKQDSPDWLFEEMPTQVLENVVEKPNKLNDLAGNVNSETSEAPNKLNDLAGNVNSETSEAPIDEMATQVLEEDEILLQKGNKSNDTTKDDKSVNVEILDDHFSEMATQIIPEDKTIDIADFPTQVLEEYVPQKRNEVPEQHSEELMSPFKIPSTPLKNKKKDSFKKVSLVPNKISPLQSPILIDDDENYYNATQDILDDLSTQQHTSPEIVKITNETDNIRNNLSNKSQVPSDADEIVHNIKMCDSSETKVVPLKRVGSDPPDAEVTPKKLRPLKLMRTELPDSQEIKTSVAQTKTSVITESSSESEVEQNSEEMTPIVFRKKQRKKKSPTDAKMDLIKKFEATAKVLPVRVISRVRKPTAKLLESDLLKPKHQTEQDEDIDNDIITENITRWKSNNDNSKPTRNDTIIKTETKTRKTTDRISKSDQNSSKISNKNKHSKSQHKYEPAVDSADPKTNTRKISIESDDQNKTCSIETGTRRTRSCKRTTYKISGINKSSSPDSDTTNSRNEKGKRKKASNSKNTEQPHDKIINVTVNNNKIINKSTSCTDTVNTDTRKDYKQRYKGDAEPKKPEKGNKKAEQTVKKDSKTKARDSRSKKTEIKSRDDSASETSVRRSTRQKNVYKSDTIDQYSEEMISVVPLVDKTVHLETHELSKVYSISSGSEDTPSLKRAAPSSVDEPSPKRTRSHSRGIRATPASRVRTQRVLFTAFNNEEVRKKLEKLGAVIVTDVKSCTVVVTMALKRTFKLLCAVGLGIPIVGPDWVQACSGTNMIVDPWLYVIKDEASEQRFKFSLQRTLVGKRNFLKGYHVSSTPKVMPTTSEMKLIVECSGGMWRACGPKWICVSCTADKNIWPELEAKGAIIVSNEFILSGVLRQFADVENNRIH